MIKSFGNKLARDIWDGESGKEVRGFPSHLIRQAERKLDLLNGAAKLGDLKIPPGNRLHPLKGDLEGFHSISINDQWRVIFRLSEGHAHDVEIIDYH